MLRLQSPRASWLYGVLSLLCLEIPRCGDWLKNGLCIADHGCLGSQAATTEYSAACVHVIPRQVPAAREQVHSMHIAMEYYIQASS